ncbi:MAG: MutS2 family protein [Dehalococcoidia bacterium]|nr:MutS2 family protein [Dehalococcoidia bacterium]
MPVSPSSSSLRHCYGRDSLSEVFQSYPEVMLRRLSVEEALPRMEQFLDEAFIGGLRCVCVIHGKGTGTLRSVVRERLSHHPLVSSYRAGLDGEGGVGVTIVDLVEK